MELKKRTMNNNIAEGGLWRLRDGQKTLESESIEGKYADQLAKATPEEKAEIYQRMAAESERREKMINHKPSAKALW
jgi:hypothetical protein